MIRKLNVQEAMLDQERLAHLCTSAVLLCLGLSTLHRVSLPNTHDVPLW